jgi:hypothetical protein
MLQAAKNGRSRHYSHCETAIKIAMKQRQILLIFRATIKKSSMTTLRRCSETALPIHSTPSRVI